MRPSPMRRPRLTGSNETLFPLRNPKLAETLSRGDIVVLQVVFGSAAHASLAR
jgi:hypothetical protein